MRTVVIVLKHQEHKAVMAFLHITLAISARAQRVALSQDSV
jgi:hypothetical protein